MLRDDWNRELPPPPPHPGQAKTSNKKKKKKKKNKNSGDNNNGVVAHRENSSNSGPMRDCGDFMGKQTKVSSKQKKKSTIWDSSEDYGVEREKIKAFWLGLREQDRRALVKLEKEAVLKKMKEQQKQTCQCSVCGRRRTVIEEELEMLYDAYYEELKTSEENRANGKGITSGKKGDSEDKTEDDPFCFSRSLTVKGGILTVADDLLKNDGRKFLDMMELFAVSRQKKTEEEGDDDDYDDEDDYDDDDYDDDDSDEELSEEQRMEEGRRMFQMFAAKMFEQRVLVAYKEDLALQKQLKLIEEEEEEKCLKDQKEKNRLEKQQKKKEKKRLQKLQQEEEERQRKEEEEMKRQEEEEKRMLEDEKRRVELRKKEEERIQKLMEAQRLRDIEEQLREEERKKLDLERERELELEKERERRRRKGEARPKDKVAPTKQPGSRVRDSSRGRAANAVKKTSAGENMFSSRIGETGSATVRVSKGSAFQPSVLVGGASHPPVFVHSVELKNRTRTQSANGSSSGNESVPQAVEKPAEAAQAASEADPKLMQQPSSSTSNFPFPGPSFANNSMSFPYTPNTTNVAASAGFEAPMSSIYDPSSSSALTNSVQVPGSSQYMYASQGVTYPGMLPQGTSTQPSVPSTQPGADVLHTIGNPGHIFNDNSSSSGLSQSTSPLQNSQLTYGNVDNVVFVGARMPGAPAVPNGGAYVESGISQRTNSVPTSGLEGTNPQVLDSMANMNLGDKRQGFRQPPPPGLGISSQNVKSDSLGSTIPPVGQRAVKRPEPIKRPSSVEPVFHNSMGMSDELQSPAFGSNGKGAGSNGDYSFFGGSLFGAGADTLFQKPDGYASEQQDSQSRLWNFTPTVDVDRNIWSNANEGAQVDKSSNNVDFLSKQMKLQIRNLSMSSGYSKNDSDLGVAYVNSKCYVSLPKLAETLNAQTGASINQDELFEVACMSEDFVLKPPDGGPPMIALRGGL
eukprot:Nk52_evm50s1671 gene=Nk52_evmTU50s1671